MNEPSPEPRMTWRFIRTYAVRMVICVFLGMAVYGALVVWVPYQREQRIARKVEALGGTVVVGYFGPEWIPYFLQQKLLFWDRITKMKIRLPSEAPLPSDLLFELGTLTKLDTLFLQNTQVTDAGLQHLKRLTNLVTLDLGNTQITNSGLQSMKGLTKLHLLFLYDTDTTDAGLRHLKGLTNLELLDLERTRTTAEGRAMLRKALPNCEIEPNP